jgi:signal transduction histidine kinase
MIDLAHLSADLFPCALESNLRQLRPLRKVESHFLSAVRLRLRADSAWLARTPPCTAGAEAVPAGPVAEGGADGRPRQAAAAGKPAGAGPERAPTLHLRGDAALCDPALVAAFLRHERREVPRTVLLARLGLGTRTAAVAGAARREEPFTAHDRRALDRLCQVLAAELLRREEERLARVLERIREKIVAELRPRDLAYQILDGLYQLVDYDHSSAFLAYDGAAGVFRIEAEKIVWTKAKSAFIGHEIRVPAERSGSFGRLITTSSSAGPADLALHQALDYHRGPGVPPVTSLLTAPLFYDGEFLGLLKIAATRRPMFDAGDIAIVERFLPAAAVSMRNAQVNRSLERQAMRAELKAGLVTLASAVAHDVNNAVGSILPLAQQMREEVRAARPDPATFDRDLGVIIDNARLCQRIFANMMRVAGAGRGTDDGPVDLNQVVCETLPFFQGQAGRRGVEVLLDLAPELPPLRATRHDLQHILLNLVHNSLDALAAPPSAGSRVLISTARAAGSGAVLTVADDGPGIRPELLDKVQEPFFSTKAGSTGLGLSICRALAWQNGGKLEVRSAPHEGVPGTRVLVTFHARWRGSREAGVEEERDLGPAGAVAVKAGGGGGTGETG